MCADQRATKLLASNAGTRCLGFFKGEERKFQYESVSSPNSNSLMTRAVIKVTNKSVGVELSIEIKI